MSTQRPLEVDEIAVEISDTQAHLAVDRDWAAGVVRATLRAEGVGRAAISVALTDDASIRVINARHLGHDYATDVISFLLSDDGDAELVGDLVISAEMAARVAAEVGVAPRDELALYMVHGLLHLCGYDDHEVDDVATMRGREAAILGSLTPAGAASLAKVAPAVAGERDRECVRWPR